ncbi:MAG TPA: hypothetical protein VFO05_06835 [Candidatus Limnocylindrales bacterium]|nr:hypothetical protein [Candidatus Limnocylindrales bacterium]
MTRSSKNVSVPAAIAIVAVGVTALIASGALRPAPVTGGTPSHPPVASPSAPATPAPTKEPIDDFSDGSKSVKLDIATDHDVYARIDDATGKVVDARSGRAGDGMSVPWLDIKVENLDDHTLRLTWVALGNDDPVKVRVFEVDGVLNLVVLQAAPPPNTDSLGYDRILVLEFDGLVRAEDVDTEFIRGMDTDD